MACAARDQKGPGLRRVFLTLKINQNERNKNFGDGTDHRSRQPHSERTENR